MAPCRGTSGAAREPVTAHEAKLSGEKWDKLEKENTELVRKGRSEGVIDVEVNGRVNPVFQKSAWNEAEETMTGLVYSFGGKNFTHFLVSRSMTM